MFGAVQWIVRHKVAVIGVAVVGFVVFGSSRGDDQPVSPWGSDAAQSAALSANESLADKAFGKVAGAAKDYAGVDIGSVKPSDLRKSTLDNWTSAHDATKRANGN